MLQTTIDTFSQIGELLLLMAKPLGLLVVIFWIVSSVWVAIKCLSALKQTEEEAKR